MIKFKQHAEHFINWGSFRMITATLVILTFPAFLVVSSQGLCFIGGYPGQFNPGLNFVLPPKLTWGFLGGSVGKALPACTCGFNPSVGKVPEEGNGNPLQYSCLGNPIDRGTTVHGVAKSWT